MKLGAWGLMMILPSARPFRLCWSYIKRGTPVGSKAFIAPGRADPSGVFGGPELPVGPCQGRYQVHVSQTASLLQKPCRSGTRETDAVSGEPSRTRTYTLTKEAELFSLNSRAWTRSARRARLAPNLLGGRDLAWSGKRGSNPRHPPWQGEVALPDITGRFRMSGLLSVGRPARRRH